MNNNDNIGWLFFGGYKNILPSMLTILPSSSTWAILLTSLAIYSCIPLKAIQYYIILYRACILFSYSMNWCFFKVQLYFNVQTCDCRIHRGLLKSVGSTISYCLMRNIHMTNLLMDNLINLPFQNADPHNNGQGMWHNCCWQYYL